VKRKWLSQIDWEFVTATNEALCRPKKTLHRASSDGYEPTRALWEKDHRRLLSLIDAVELCRECHRLAPFCNFNGNTFVAIVRALALRFALPPDRAYAVRGWMGHIVAGTASDEETKQFRAFSDSLTEEEIR
jgi:hypothetical protein